MKFVWIKFVKAVGNNRGAAETLSLTQANVVIKCLCSNHNYNFIPLHLSLSLSHFVRNKIKSIISPETLNENHEDIILYQSRLKVSSNKYYVWTKIINLKCYFIVKVRASISIQPNYKLELQSREIALIALIWFDWTLETYLKVLIWLNEE